jgi:anti-anti-sigma regulatory factor
LFRVKKGIGIEAVIMPRISFNSINLLHLPFVDRFEEVGNVRILRFKGPIDRTTLPEILKIKKVLERQDDLNKNNVIIDFKKITHVDSAAIAALLIELGLVNVTEELKIMLDIFKAGKLFMIFDSEEAALQSFRPA